MDNSDPSLTSSNNSTPTNVATSILANSDDVASEDRVSDASSHSGNQLGCYKAAEFDSNKLTVDKDCTECSITRPDPSASQLVMYLHALSYQVTMITIVYCACVRYDPLVILTLTVLHRALTGSFTLAYHHGPHTVLKPSVN